MDHTPRALFAMINAGLEEDALGSNTPWFCVSCYACTARCPQEIPITDIMYTLKEMAIQAGRFEYRDAAEWSETFIGFVEQRGRSFEAGLATRYHLFHHPERAVKLGMMGMGMFRRNRLSLRPKSIQNVDQLQAILTEAKAIAAKERRA
jgi:heterodisulfide reductase subunit C